MTDDKGKQAVGGRRPCASCSGTAEALRVLAMALRTAQDALVHIRVPIPNEVALAMGYSAVPQADLPQQLRDMCARMGYLVLEQDPIRVPDLTDPDFHSDAISVASSTLSDWTQTPTPSELGDPVPPPAVTTTSAQPEAEGPADDRWYAVISGRNPGVHRGSQNLAGNATGVPGGFAQRYATHAKAQAAYDEALALGKVYKITFDVGRDQLHPPGPSGPPPPPPAAGAAAA
ncbi:hypothetical protein FPV67DRAFT_1666947 [Lyophyllum atratum]|nr:hypothetical protein FPV67DRAFT_1666947 [Lyophyllum atratum]